MSSGLLKTLNPIKYLLEVRDELQKVTWPSRQQTIQKTSLVILVSVAVGAYIGALDYIFTKITAVLIK